MKRYRLLLSMILLASSMVLAQMPMEEELYASVLGIEGRTHQERNEFIKGQLHKIGVGFVTASFKNIPRLKKKDTVVVTGEYHRSPWRRTQAYCCRCTLRCCDRLTGSQ